MLIYVLINDEGEYSDRTVSNIGVFSTLDKAIEALIEMLNRDYNVTRLTEERCFHLENYYIQARELDKIEPCTYIVYSLEPIKKINNYLRLRHGEKFSSPEGFHIVSDSDKNVKIITPQIAELNRLWTRKFYSSQYIETR